MNALNEIFDTCDSILRSSALSIKATKEPLDFGDDLAFDETTRQAGIGVDRISAYNCGWGNTYYEDIRCSLKQADSYERMYILSDAIANIPKQFIEKLNSRAPFVHWPKMPDGWNRIPEGEWRDILCIGHTLAQKIIRLILIYKIDLDLLCRMTGKDLRHLAGDSPSASTAQQPEPVTEKRKSTFTLAQRVLLFKHVFGEMGICEKEDGTTNLAQLARLIHEMIGEDSRDVDLDNSNVYKALKKLNKQADADNDKLVKELTQLGFSDLAEKLK